MAIFLAAFTAGVAGFWAGHAHARWIVRSELRGLVTRVTAYTYDRDKSKLSAIREAADDEGLTPIETQPFMTRLPGKPW